MYAHVFKRNPYHDAGGKFTSKDRAHNADSAKWHKEDGSRQLAKGLVTETPLPRPTAEITAYHVKDPNNFGSMMDAASVKSVKVSELVTGQAMVEGNRLKEWRDDAPPIEVAIYQGVAYVMQGNHRAASAWAADKKEIKAKVLDLDDKKNSKAMKSKYRIKKGYAEILR